MRGFPAGHTIFDTCAYDYNPGRLSRRAMATSRRCALLACCGVFRAASRPAVGEASRSTSEGGCFRFRPPFDSLLGGAVLRRDNLRSAEGLRPFPAASRRTSKALGPGDRAASGGGDSDCARLIHLARFPFGPSRLPFVGRPSVFWCVSTGSRLLLQLGCPFRARVVVSPPTST